MARLGYGNVSAEGFVAFGRDLDESAWSSIDVGKRGKAGELPPLRLGLSVEVYWKLLVCSSLDALSRVLASLGSEATDALDAEWDGCQKRLHLTTALALEARDKATREAARRVRAALLLGDGTAQTRLEYNTEVDFGRKQLRLSAQAPLSGDVKSLGLSALLGEVATATEALAVAIGRSGGDAAQPPRSKRVRLAQGECVSACNAVHGALDGLIDRTPVGEARDQLAALRKPFEALLARHAPDAEAAAATEPTPTE